MSTALTTIEGGQEKQQGFTREQVDLLKRTICAGATDDELKLFIATTERLSLDPFARQVFAVKRYDSRKRAEVMSIQVSIDGFRLVAERTGHYAGQLGPYWTADGEKWVEVWLKDAPPAAAKVAVLRNDFKEPLWAVATWAQYKQEGQGGLTPMWRKMGPLMLAKCAESLALRRAFPNELSGVYTAEEMAQATPADEHPSPKPQRPQDPRAVVDLGPSDLHSAKEAAPDGPKDSAQSSPQQSMAIDTGATTTSTAGTNSATTDTGEAPTMEAQLAIANQLKKLGWKKPQAVKWLRDLFGFESISALTQRQTDTAFALLLAHGTGKYDAMLIEAEAKGEILPEAAA